MRPTFLCLAALWFATLTTRAAEPAPSSAFDLSQWKLQIPGPREFKDLRHYSSDYFHLNAEKEMCFHLDAAEKGATLNAHYVRSELRHFPNWKTTEAHSMSAEVRVISHLQPDKVTVLQIHGIKADGKDAPPLLRVAVNKGDLVAVLKTDSTGDQNDTLVLKKNLGGQTVKVDITVEHQQLTIRVNGEEALSRNLAYWTWLNYFKAGCYPQATSGTADVFFRKLTAR
jgi:alginate lyase